MSTETNDTLVAFCKNLDGSSKAELHRKPISNPITRSFAGEWSWEVWHDAEPETVVRYMDEEKARQAFRSAMAHGTNGFGGSQ